MHPTIISYLIVLASSVAIFTACNNKDNTAQNKQQPKMLSAKAVIVQEQEINAVYQASGNLLSNEEVMLYPETSGRITGLYFKEGSNVKKGTILVQLYDGDIIAQLQKLTAQKE